MTTANEQKVEATATTTEKPNPEVTTEIKAEPAKAEQAASMVTTPDATAKEGEVKDQKVTPAVTEKFELKLPDGSKLDANYLTKAEALAKEKGWNNERAQEHINDRNAAIIEYEQEQQQALSIMNDKTWKEQLMNDPDFGGKNFEENGILAHKAAEKFGGKEFADEIKSLKLNHHPKFFPFLVRIAKAMDQDKFVNTNNNLKGSEPVEKNWYPNMK